MDHHVARHLGVFDPFGHGDSAASLGLMMNLTDGFEYPWRVGGVALIRRALYPEPRVWTYCGLAIGADTQLANYPGMTHGADQGYQYATVAFLGNGFVSQAFEPIRLDFDGDGDLITPRLPMFPLNIVAEPRAGGKFRIAFEYDPHGQGGSPADFQVFEGADPESVVYETPLTDSETGLTVVPYRGDRRVFAFTTAGYKHGSSHVFAVRARSVNEVA